MNLDDLTIREAREIARLFSATQPATMSDPHIGKLVVVRTYSAGVHVGTLESRMGTEAVLRDARRLWSWSGANTLNEVAMKGVAEASRVSEPVSTITLTQVIEIIPVSYEAAPSLTRSRWSN